MTEKICFKYLRNILSGTLLLLSAAGCSKNDAAVPNDFTSGEESWVNDPSQRVPITFASYGMSSETKAVKPGVIDGTAISGLDVGIFALAVTDDHEPAESGVSQDNVFNTHQYPQTWRLADRESLLLTNEKVTTGSNGYIELKDKFYPLDDTYQYSFYSYYPYMESTRGQSGSDGDYYSVTYELGNTDVLYAYDDAYRFKSYPGELGFNGGYIRFLKKHEEGSQYYTDYKPKLVFRHLLTALAIQANSTADASSVRVVKVELKDVYTSATLYVADSRTSGNMSGKMEPAGEPVGTTITLKGGENGEKTDFSDIALGTEYTELSKFIVFPGDEAHPVSKFMMEVTLGTCSSDGTLTGSTVEKTATVTPPKGKTVFEAGKKYTVNITIDDAVSFEIATELNEFGDGKEATFTWTNGNKH